MGVFERCEISDHENEWNLVMECGVVGWGRGWVVMLVRVVGSI